MSAVRGLEIHNGYILVPISEGSLLLGRLSSMTKSGANITLGASYTYGELIELRSSITSWTGIGGSFTMMLMRAEVAVDSTGKGIRALEVDCANVDTFSITTLSTFIFSTMGKGNSTITLMRGGEVACSWLATDTVTDARCLQLEFGGLSTPTNNVYGLWFETDSATAAMAAKVREIRMKTGLLVFSGSGVPSIAAPKGSLYLRTDGTTTNDRAYINTDGSTTWTAITTAA